MAELGEQFDSSQHNDMINFDPVQKDQYYGKIVDSEIKDSASTPGNRYIQLKVELMGKGLEHGEDASGKFVWPMLHKWNKNEKAVNMANRELATIIRACKLVTVQDTMQLHEIPMLLDIDVIPADGQYPPKNEIKNYQPVQGASGANTQGTEKQEQKPVETTQQAPTNTAQVESQSNGGGEVAAAEKPPWEM
jgi:hypothetical protein